MVIIPPDSRHSQRINAVVTLVMYSGDNQLESELGYRFCRMRIPAGFSCVEEISLRK
jgi:hypothetical protein